MGMNGGNMQKMMKQMQKMQKDMERMQAEIAQRTVEASAGGGAVTVTASTAIEEIQAVKINPDAVDLDDIEMLEDMVLAATNEALKKAQEMMTQELGKLTGGLNIPGLF